MELPGKPQLQNYTGKWVALAVATLLLLSCCPVSAQTTSNVTETTTATAQDNSTTGMPTETTRAAQDNSTTGMPIKTTTADRGECQRGVCGYAAVCEQLTDDYICYCGTGRTGRNCTEDIDECNAAGPDPCAHRPRSHCVNTDGGYRCECDQGLEPVPPDNACKAKVFLNYYPETSGSFAASSNVVYGPTEIPGGGFMIGDEQITTYYVYDDGYITFNKQFRQLTMPPEDSERLTSIYFIAPYWTDIQYMGNNTEGKIYIRALRLTDTFRWNTTRDLFEEYTEEANLTAFEPVFIGLITWTHALPYPADDFPNFQPAEFQLMLATDGTRMEGRAAWRTTWSRGQGIKVTASHHVTTDRPVSWMPLEVPSVANFSSSPPASAKPSVAPCMRWMGAQAKRFQDSSPSCPCSLLTARADLTFMEESSSSSSSGQVCLESTVFLELGGGVKSRCCYSSSDGLLTGNMTQQRPAWTYRDSALDSLALEGFTKCCPQGNPSTCGRYWLTVSPPVCGPYTFPHYTAMMWGSGHMTGGRGLAVRTLNGVKEYHLLTSNTTTTRLEVQGRSEMKSYVAAYNTTVFTAVVFKVDDKTPVEVHANAGSGRLELKKQGAATTVDAVKNESKDIHLSLSDSGDVLVLVLPSSIALKITAVEGGLDIFLQSASGMLSGLMGNITGIINSTVSQTDFETMVEMFELQSNQSLFHYKNGESFDTYNNHTDFQSPDLDVSVQVLKDKLNMTGVSEEDVGVCGDSMVCLKELLVTGSVTKANATLTMLTDYRQHGHIYELSKLQSEGYMVTWKVPLAMSGSGFPKELTELHNPMITVTNVTVEVHTVPANISLNYTIQPPETDGGPYKFMWYPDESVRNLTDLTLTFTAIDPGTGQRLKFRPTVLLCACEDTSQCRYEAAEKIAADMINGGFVLAQCACIQWKGGRFCERDVSACDVCYNASLCDTRCRCPQGYEGQGRTCYEKDECLKPDMCEQVCTNTVGSYVCSCHDGYTLDADGLCQDIDECQSGQDNCTEGEFCYNTEGSFLCYCNPNFAGEGCQKKVKYRYAGKLTFADRPLIGQGWSPDLMHMRSGDFMKMAAKIETLISDLLTTNSVPFVDVSVISFEHMPARTRRSTGGNSSPQITAQYEVTSNQLTNMTSLQAAVTSAFNPDCVSSACSMSNSSDVPVLYGVDRISVAFLENNDLCASVRTNDCHQTSTTCVSENNGFRCACRHGYQYWPLQDNVCIDIDECEGGTLQELCGLPTNDTQCLNTDGSYYCHCPPSYMWSPFNSSCVEVALEDTCSASQPCKNGAECVNTMDEARFACRCTDGWSGKDCGDEDSEAEHYKAATIGVAVGLGVLCLILLIVVIVLLVRKARTYSME